MPLCVNCRDIRFYLIEPTPPRLIGRMNLLFNGPNKHQYKATIYRNRDDFQNYADPLRCNFCRLVFHFVATDLSIEPKNLGFDAMQNVHLNFEHKTDTAVSRARYPPNDLQSLFQGNQIWLRGPKWNELHVVGVNPPGGILSVTNDIGLVDGDTHTGSSGNIAIAKSWLNRCLSQHPVCSRPATAEFQLPTRLLDLSTEGLGNDIALCESTVEDLHEESRENMEYATFSHRWGKTQPLKTSANNYERHTQRILFNDLPKTFQDAVKFTRAMGIRFLWIDSLCILQDSSIDKERQLPKMVDYYSNAVFNIAATQAKDSSGGCFRNRNPITAHAQPLPVTVINKRKTQCSGVLELSPGDINTHLGENALQNRGWIFQEEAFSRRIFSFEQKLLKFERKEFCACEMFPNGVKTSSTLSKIREIIYPNANEALQHAGNSAPEWLEFYQAYRSATERYVQLNFTFEADRLPGLSGLASRIAMVTLDTYLAGHWTRTLLWDICWINWTTDSKTTRRFQPYRAPSWSWASLTGPVEIHFQRIDTDAEMFVEYISARTETAGENPYGDVEHGELHVRGCLKRVLAVRKPIRHGREVGFWNISDDGDRKGDMIAVVRFDCESDIPPGPTEIWLLPVLRVSIGEKRYDVAGLALKKVERPDLAILAVRKPDFEIYERLGCFREPDKHRWLSSELLRGTKAGPIMII